MATIDGMILTGVLVVGLAVGFLLGGVFTSGRMQPNKAIIENNCGYYDPMTSEFKFGRLK